MKAEGVFISTLLVVDTFLVSFCFGFNSRHVLVVDPSLPSVLKTHTEQIPKKNGALTKTDPTEKTTAKPAAKPIGSIGNSHHKSGESKAISQKANKTDKAKTGKKGKTAGKDAVSHGKGAGSKNSR